MAPPGFTSDLMVKCNIMPPPSISIIIPTYRGKYLAETVQSVLAQTVSDWELVIVDDGSPDGTFAAAQELAGRDPRIQAMRTENGGESRARNAGLARTDARSPYVIFLDHDDLWEPDALQTLRGALEAAPEALGAYGIGQFVDPDNAPCQPGELESWCRLRKRLSGGRFVDCAPGDLTTLETIAYHLSIPTPGVCLLRRSTLPTGDLFKPEMRSGSGDMHLWMRLARGGGFAFVDKSVIRGRRHDANMTNQRRLIDRSVVQAYLDVLALPETNAAHRAILQQGYRAGWRDKARGSLHASARLLGRGRALPAAKELARAARNFGRAAAGLPAKGRLISRG